MTHEHASPNQLQELLTRLEALPSGDDPTPLPAALDEALGTSAKTLVKVAMCRTCANRLHGLRRDLRGVRTHEEISANHRREYVLQLLNAGCTHIRIKGKRYVVMYLHGEGRRVRWAHVVRSHGKTRYFVASMTKAAFFTHLEEAASYMAVTTILEGIMALRGNVQEVMDLSSVWEFLGWDGRIPGDPP